jgi:hypothetical protein
MEPIHVIGIDKLSEDQIETANTLANEYYEKLQRGMKNITSLIIHVKTYDDQGGKKRYAINSRVSSPSHHFESNKATDWDFARTFHKTLKDLERQVEHGLHVSDQK